MGYTSAYPYPKVGLIDEPTAYNKWLKRLFEWDESVFFVPWPTKEVGVKLPKIAKTRFLVKYRRDKLGELARQHYKMPGVVEVEKKRRPSPFVGAQNRKALMEWDPEDKSQLPPRLGNKISRRRLKELRRQAWYEEGLTLWKAGVL